MSGASGFVVEEFRVVTKGALRGWATVMQPSGQRIDECDIYRKDGRWWVSPSSKPRIGRDGMQMKDPAGKPLWSPVVSFASRQLSDRWSDSVLAALRTSHPHVLDELAVSA
jgi:hypothetical protein